MRECRFRTVGLAGTFDRLHEGHAALLRKAFDVGERVVIGVMSDAWVKRSRKLLKAKIFPYASRVRFLRAFMRFSRIPPSRYAIRSLNADFQPSLLTRRNPIEAVVCSTETKNGVNRLNHLRKQRGLPSLAVITVRMVNAPHLIVKQSSTRLRVAEKRRFR